MDLSKVIDSHGYVDVFKDSNLLSEIKISCSKQGNTIQGSTLNLLLRGLFTLFCDQTDSCHLPGDEIMARVHFMIYRYFVEPKEDYERIALGSLSFLYYWVQCYSSFISDINVCRIHASVEKLSTLFEHSIKAELFSQLRHVTFSCVRSRNKLPNTLTLDDPNLFGRIRGRWNGKETQLKREQVLESLAKAPMLRLEIFGGDLLMERFAGDSDEESQHDISSVQQKQAISVNPVSHIQDGLSLLRPPFVLAIDLLLMDTLELARQWTLLDHALFIAIPLHSLMAASSASYAQARHKIVRTGTGNCGIVGGARRFIDRFNAASLWMTHSVLSRNSSEERGAVVSKLIRLAGHMLDLCNFNGLMAVLTALQQGCISRLVITFSHVSKSEKTLLTKLQRLTAGSKNYQKYREEVTRLVPTILSARGGDATDTSEGDDLAVSMEWRKYIYETHYGTSATQTSPGGSDGGDALYSNVGGEIGSELDEHLTADKTTAIVPHIGAHLAELASIAEGNADFVTDCPHLFNMHKLRLLASTMSTLRKMQSMRYRLTPVRSVAAAINICVKRHMKLLTGENTDYSTKLFEWSAAKETDQDIDVYLLGVNDVVTTSTITHVQLTRQASPEDRSLSVAPPRLINEDSLPPTSPASPRHKYRKSDAYDSILSGTTSSREAKRRAMNQGSAVRSKSVLLPAPILQLSNNNRDGDEDSNDGDEEEEEKAASSKTFTSPHRLLRQASTLMRTMSFVNRS